MKKYRFIFNLFLVFTLPTYCCYSQQNDNIWMLSWPYSFSNTTTYYLDFHNGSPDTILQQRKMFFNISNSTLSDSIGNLQFYTNGVAIFNKTNDTLLNSQNFNIGYYTNYYQTIGLGFSQSTISFPKDSNLYYLIHSSAENITNSDGDLDVEPRKLRYSVIDMDLDNGNGAIPIGKKGLILIDDTLLLGRITATKHANGRDWWVVTHKYYSNIYYKFLFTPDSVYGPFSQQIGSLIPPKFQNGLDNDILGMSVFSPDGSKYAMIGVNGSIELLNFDRCSGSFIGGVILQIPDTTNTAVGCSFSSNSRYLYANSLVEAYQFDTDILNVQNSLTLVAQYDSFVNPSPSWFFLNQLGPDGKIYLSTYNSTRKLHIIQNPDSAGLNCNFVQHGYALPPNYSGNITIPNFPNYRLGRLLGSPCDTITGFSSLNFIMPEIVIEPNPNMGNFTLKYSLEENSDGVLQVTNILGQSVYKQNLPLFSNTQQIQLPYLKQGVYFCEIRSGNSLRTLKFLRL